ncbi:MAG: bifunctional phosphopantothenoylcysteine decarboxylase/phosphopantothenate--cysteine ligase CoaBC [Bacteroidales bacterium]|nr:bifunctional phosphopantothenoylcysteine decarboxylase/phosphopantothenate--cysteine ligase CoaBC [Bacteroidales bacterium]
MLQGKKIVVGITGGIAAYKIPLLVRLLKKEGAEVKVVMTDFSKSFVTPLTLATVSGEPVYSEFFNPENGLWHSHVDLGLWADAMILAPLTANTMAKMASGVADNFLLTVILSARCPVFFAPTMDMDMFQHPVTQENIRKLIKLGYHYVPPSEGFLASGLDGPGRMSEPEELAQVLNEYFSGDEVLQGKKVLISAGPTHEPFDAVRFIGNRSSGKMGIALAKAFAQKGALVHLVLGPVSFDVSFPGITVYPVETAAEMADQCKKIFTEADVAIMAAAVADFTPVHTSESKIKKEGGFHSIEVKATEDILASLGKSKRKDQLLIGFALETDNEFQNAQKKLEKKNLDMIVLNSLKDSGAGFGTDTNKVTILNRNGDHYTFDLKSKEAVATDIISEIKALMEEIS